jgi:hypothetical protein
VHATVIPAGQPPDALSWRAPGVLLASLVVAVASLAVVAPAPSYDPWAWLLWGREVTELRLSTAEGPAFKPLPVAIGALLAPTGSAAPWLWVLIARTAAAAAVLLAFRLGRELSGGSAGGLLAAVAVLLTGQFAGYAASGMAEGMLVGCALAALASHRSGHPRATVAWGTACALLRVETWPLLALAALVAARRAPALRPGLVILALLIPAAWFVPELLGSGDLLRSGTRARMPNPGQPALAPVPAVASLSDAMRIVPWPIWLGIAVLAVRARDHVRLAPAAVGLTWIAIVAAMAQAGFSGEARYAMPGAALIGISGAVGLARVAGGRSGPIPRFALVTAATALMLVARSDSLTAIAPGQAHQWRLAQDLEHAIARVGGRERVLACGTPYVGRLRGPLMAYALDIRKSRVEADDPAVPHGMVFRSAMRPASTPAPDVPGSFAPTVRVGAWTVFASCPPEWTT